MAALLPTTEARSKSVMSNDHDIIEQDGSRLVVNENDGLFWIDVYPGGITLDKVKLLEVACSLIRVYWLYATEEEKQRLQFEIRAQVPARGML